MNWMYESKNGYTGQLLRGSRLAVTDPRGLKILELRDLRFNDSVYAKRFVDNVPRLLIALGKLGRDR